MNALGENSCVGVVFLLLVIVGLEDLSLLRSRDGDLVV
jgi:hypothetical protein